jgi:hypothetical protein
MKPSLDGCWAKVNRAYMHLSLLDARVGEFVDSDAYRFDREIDLKEPERLVVILYAEAMREPQTEIWGAIIGDAVHNLRSALDHLVWQLTLANGHTPPAEIPRRRNAPNAEWRDIGFPIHSIPYPLDVSRSLIPWDRAKEPKSLWGIRPSLRAQFQRLQPFTHGKNAPKEPLAILNELWNIDKHRHLNLTNFLVGLHDVGSAKPELEFRVLQKRAPGPFKGRTEIGRVEHIGPPYSPIYQMEMQPHIAFDVAFEEGPPAYGGRAVKTLVSLHDTVSAILGDFDSEFT